MPQTGYKADAGMATKFDLGGIAMLEVVVLNKRIMGLFGQRVFDFFGSTVFCGGRVHLMEP